MANNTVYITAGLPVAKASGQSPTSQVNTVYITAGLPKPKIYIINEYVIVY